MEFYNKVVAFAEKARMLKAHIKSEEATKTALVMPFFSQILGYDVNDPREFVPEYKANFKSNGNDRVDFAVLVCGYPVILVEAKYVGEPLEPHVGQLAGYFAPTDAKFAVLTNGVAYRFYSDVLKRNIMDDVSFLDIDLLALDKRTVVELESFSKSNFNINYVANRAFELIHENAIYAKLSAEIESPSDAFIHLLSGDSNLPVETLKPVVKTAITRYISDNAMEVTAAPALFDKPTFEPGQTSDISLKAFALVKSIVESTGSKHRYKLKLNETNKYVTVNYRRCSLINLLKTQDGYFDIVRFYGTSIETRKQTINHDISGIDDISSLRDLIIKQLEFIDWWYLNPRADKGGIE